MAPDEQLAFDFHSTSDGETASPEGVIQPKIEGRSQTGRALPPQPGGLAVEGGVWRPIHYLGSKLRLVDEICQAVQMVDPSGGPVCDLFAGSGTVAMALSRRRRVVAVDVQEYSRVLCSALLSPATIDFAAVEPLIDAEQSGEDAHRLRWAAGPMLEAEAEAMRLARLDSPERLCEFLEGSSLVGHELGGGETRGGWLEPALIETTVRMSKMRPDEQRWGIVTRYYGGIYFSFRQAVQIDALLSFVRKMDIAERDTYLAAVLSATSEAVNTVGKQFAQPIRPRHRDGRPKADLVDKVIRDRSIDVTRVYKNWLVKYARLQRGRHAHRVIRADFTSALGGLIGDVAAVYADPPYTRDHYSRFYHVLETLSLGDAPSIATVKTRGEVRLSRGLYRNERHQSPFCIKSQAPSAFRDLFDGVRRLGVPLVVSYSPYRPQSRERPRVVTLDGLRAMADAYFKRVETYTPRRMAHSKLNRNDMNAGIRKDAEVLLVCLP